MSWKNISYWNIKIDYISASENPEWDTAHRESIGSVSIIQKGGFQPEFASRTYEVRAIGTGSGFSAQAFLKKGTLVGDDNPDLKSQQAHFEVIKINQSGSITELRILDRGVYEIFPAEFERGVALKYSDNEMESKAMLKRPMGVGYGARVQCTARSVINCQQPPRIVEDNAGPSRPADATELLADAINTAGGLDGGLTASSLPINTSVSSLQLKTDADGLELSDLVPGTLDAIGLQGGDYGPGSFGFGADLGDGGTGFGLGDSGIRKDNPFDKWQMPQGGVDLNEPLLKAMKRELIEETSIRNIEVLKEFDQWLEYELPENLIGKIWKGKYKGQKQKWFIVRFLGNENEIDINTKHPEFIEWQWVDIEKLPSLIVLFKKHVYEKITIELKKFIN